MATTNEPQTVTKANKGDWSRTLGYVGVAAACLGITGMANLFSRPAKIEEFGKVGQEFYPEFTDPTLASGLEVFVFDSEEVRAREFQVARQENGLWVIPSHHDYPADAEERLAKTASSIIGIKRGAMVTRWNADHGRYGVINPKQESLSVEDVEGVGQRLILRKDDDSVLADFVIGKQVDDRAGEFYVRHPDEDEVYIAKLDIDLSTKFTDWIEDKLFEFSSGDVVQLDINDYVFDDRTVTESIETQLSREQAWGDNWDMDGLDTESQEVDTQKLNDALSALADLEAIGVRPKQKGLTPELTLDREFLRMQSQLDLLQQDLFTRGFALQPGASPEAFSLISREGELKAGTEDGLQYHLYFGRVFTGSEEELEIGFGDGDDVANAASSSDEADDAAATSEDESANASNKPGRYLFVRVVFDDSLISGPRSAPIEPEKPERLRALEAEEKEAAADETATDDESDEAADTGEGDEETQDEPSELETLRAEYEAAQQQYETDLRDYESRQEKIKEGKEKAEEFNRRFAEWYYVVPGESFEKLDIARADLIKAKEADAEADGADAAAGSVTPPFVPPVGAESAFDTETSDSASNTDESSIPEPDANPTETAEPLEDAADAGDEGTSAATEEPSSDAVSSEADATDVSVEEEPGDES